MADQAWSFADDPQQHDGWSFADSHPAVPGLAPGQALPGIGRPAPPAALQGPPPSAVAPPADPALSAGRQVEQNVQNKTPGAKIMQGGLETAANIAASPVTGAVRMAKGLGQLATNTPSFEGGEHGGDSYRENLTKGLADTVGGAAEAATIPGMVAGGYGMVSNPIKTALAAMQGYAGQKLGEGITGAMGGSPAAQELAGYAGGLLGGAAGWKTGKGQVDLPRNQQPSGNWWKDLAVNRRWSEWNKTLQDWWGESLKSAQAAIGMSSKSDDAISRRISALKDVKDLTEPGWNHPIGAVPGGSELQKLQDSINATDATKDKVWDTYKNVIIAPAVARGTAIPMTNMAPAITARVRPDLFDWQPGSKQAMTDRVNARYGNAQPMGANQMVSRISTINQAERGLLNSAPNSAEAALSTQLQAAELDAERQELLDRLHNSTALPGDTDNVVGRVLRERWGALNELYHDQINARNSTLVDPGMRSKIALLARAGVQAGMGEYRGTASNLASALASSLPQPNAGSRMADAFRQFKMPGQQLNIPKQNPLLMLPPGGQPGSNFPGNPPYGIVPGAGTNWNRTPPPPTWSMQGAPQLESGPKIVPAERAAKGLPPAPQKLLPASQTIVTPPPPDTSGPIPGRQGPAMPLVTPEGEVKGFSSNQAQQKPGESIPVGLYQAGETRKINGTTFTRDETGHWHPLSDGAKPIEQPDVVAQTADKLFGAYQRATQRFPGTTASFYALRSDPELAGVDEGILGKAAQKLQDDKRALLVRAASDHPAHTEGGIRIPELDNGHTSWFTSMQGR